jgi:uncharacterized membrane-anchored protein YitT (DUF2179 family)
MLDTVKKLSFVVCGLFLTSLGIKFLSLNNLLFGGTAGIASLINFAIDYSWGFLFFLVNLPFFLISFQKLGRWFTISSLLSIMGISVIRDLLDYIAFPEMPMILSSLLAGLFIGIGVTFVLNNGSSLGGIHILALYMDSKIKINRGITIFVADSLIVLFSAIIVGWINALISIVSILLASWMIGRYKKSPIKEMEQDQEEALYNVTESSK